MLELTSKTARNRSTCLYFAKRMEGFDQIFFKSRWGQLD